MLTQNERAQLLSQADTLLSQANAHRQAILTILTEDDPSKTEASGYNLDPTLNNVRAALSDVANSISSALLLADQVLQGQ